MRFSFSLLALALLAACAATPQQGAVKLDFGVLRGRLPGDLGQYRRGGIVRRDDLAALTLTNEQTYYSANLKLGSDGQEVSVLVDTGSLDLWVMSSDVECTSSSSDYYAAKALALDNKRRILNLEKELGSGSNGQVNKRATNSASTVKPGVETVYTVTGGAGTTASTAAAGANTCTQDGSFNTDTSDSFSKNSTASEFYIEYADGTTATGFWGTDFVSILSANVSDVSFAVVNSTSSDFGVMGIGLEGLESTYSLSNAYLAYTYENFPVRLKRSGAIKKVAYSLFLNDDDSSSGLVLFGAVDHAKYSGQLTTVPIINIYSGYYDNPIRLDVVLDSISFETTSKNITNVNSSMAALLDSGTTYSYFPTWALEEFSSALGASYSSSAGLYAVDCDYNSDDAYAVFNFSGAVIKVPLSELILDYQNKCYLSILEQSSTSSNGLEYAVLGDNFLRSAYVVYDLEDYQISLAQASYSDQEDIEVISSSVPLAVSAEYYSSTSLSDSSGTSEVTKLSSSLLKSSDASRSSTSRWTMAAVFTALICFSLL